MRTFLLISFFTIFLFHINAQKNLPFDKTYFKDKIGLKNAISAIKDGDSYIEIEENYDFAIELYMEAYGVNPNNAMLNYKIGRSIVKCHHHTKQESLKYLEKALKLDSSVDPLLFFYLARANHLNGRWLKALDFYDKHLGIYTEQKGDENLSFNIENINRRIEECKRGIKLSKKPLRVFIDNLGPKVNSKYPDFAPVISADETLLFFTSRREESTGGKIDMYHEYFEDIYVAKRKDKHKNWKKATNIGYPINTKGHDATVGLTPDGDEILVYRDGDLFAYIFEEEEWSQPVKFPSYINNKRTRETSASLSPDKKTLYFVSDAEENSYGGHDIYVSHQKPNGEWGKPKNLSPFINTKYDEDGVFIHPDGKTLYFSSNGHNSIGGYDIFKSVLIHGEWSTPINMGIPINTPDDDLFFVIDAGGKHAYYASNREEGYGEKDIYKITILGPEKPVLINTEDNLIASIADPIKAITHEPKLKLETNDLTIFKGNVVDYNSKKPILATLEVTDNKTNEVIASIHSHKTDGKFLITLTSGKNYGISVKANGYLFHSENFNLPEGGNFHEVNKDILLKDIKVGSNIILKNTFFEQNKSELTSESEKELKNAYQLLKDNPTIKIEISGHTDNVGSDSYNQKLSEARAKSVVDYLVGLGITKERLAYKGFGEKKPIESNETESGRKQNRRTELKVIGV